MRAGLIGLGNMGEAIALRLLHAGVELRVWNRTPARIAKAVAAGARAAASPDALFTEVPVILLMLRGETAIDAVLGRRGDILSTRVAGRCFVQLGTVAPDYSVALQRAIRACGGHYVEAPLSGSRLPAEQGRLIGMVAGEVAAVAAARPLLERMCSRLFDCGAVGEALRLKLAVNHYLITTVTALAETVNAAQAAGVDLHLLQAVLDSGPMASEVSRTKLAKMLDGDDTAHASIADVADIARRIREQTERAIAHAPLIGHSAALFDMAERIGLGRLDMCALRQLLAARSGPQTHLQPTPEIDMSSDPTDASVTPAALHAAELPSRSRPSAYPAPFAQRVQGRAKTALGDPFGLRGLGVNLTRLAPGAMSALRHAHSHEDEFVYILEGHPTLYTDAGATPLAPGMCAGFAAGNGNAHHLVNESAEDALYLEIGTRVEGDQAHYPDDDLVASKQGGAWRFLHKDGTPY